MKTVIVDTNFLLIPEQFGVDIISEMDRILGFNYELAIMDKTIDELERLGEVAKTRIGARIGKQIIEKNDFRIISSSKQKHVDLLILDYCKEHDCIVATQDVEFKRKLREEGISVITLRKKQYLVLLEP